MQLPIRATDKPKDKVKVTRPLTTHIILILIGLFFVLPLLGFISTSLKSQAQNIMLPPVWIPTPIHLENYLSAITDVPFLTFLLNTIVITILQVAGVLFSSAFVAYGFSHLRWRGRNTLFLIAISTMLLPYEVMMIPQYIIFSKLGWIDTFLPLIVPCFFGFPFYIFLLRQFFMTIPNELIEASRLDGASEIRIFWQVVLPLVRPALAVVILLQFVASWNDFLGPLLYLNDQNLFTLTLGMQYFHTSLYQVDVGAEAAYALLIALPVVVIFFFAQRQFMQGITLTGLKG
jgi:multiple sugar transport system permease protein